MTCMQKTTSVSQKGGERRRRQKEDGGAERLEDAEEAVRVQQQADVCEAVLAHVTWRAGEQSTLWRLEAYAERG